MSAKRLRLEIAGELIVGLAFRNEAELERFLLNHCIFLDDVPPPARAVPQVQVDRTPANADRNRDLTAPEPPRRRGRPSMNRIIDEAVRELGDELDQHADQAPRARLVQRMIARTAPPESVPAVHTIELWLAEHRPFGKAFGKSVGKPKRSKTVSDRSK
jgi:hypothetical protein